MCFDLRFYRDQIVVWKGFAAYQHIHRRVPVVLVFKKPCLVGRLFVPKKTVDQKKIFCWQSIDQVSYGKPNFSRKETLGGLKVPLIHGMETARRFN